MKRTARFLISMVIGFAILLLNALNVNSGIMGDINADGKVDLQEAIYALQVASGMKPQVSSFKGTYNFSEQYDLNISNGVALGLGSLVFEVTNGITLCESCHHLSGVHTDCGPYERRFQEAAYMHIR